MKMLTTRRSINRTRLTEEDKMATKKKAAKKKTTKKKATKKKAKK
jgi:hypothetical protein